MTAITEYQGHAFHAGFRNGRASGTLQISADHIRFHNGQAEVRLPLEGLQCDLGGASDRLVFLSHASEPRWKLYTSDLTLLADPHLQQVPAVRAQLQRASRKRTLNWSIFAAICAVIVLAPVLLLFNMDALTGPVARQVPPEWEQGLGAQALKQYRLTQAFMDQDKAEALLQPLLQPLLDANPDTRFPFRFHINRDEQVNAFALPGGFVVINSGLILRAETPEELLGVVAHEMVHVTEQHGIRNIIGSAGIYLTVSTLLGDVSGLLAVLVEATPFLLNQRYSRGFETAADEKGAQLLLTARIDPRGLSRFFEKLKEEEDRRLKELAGEDNHALAKATLSMLSTHPATEHRIRHLEKITQVPAGARFLALDEPFLQLQQAVRQFVTHSDQE